MQPEVLDRSHRLGRATLGGKPVPIIAKFTDYSHRQKVLSARKLLKGVGISISKRALDNLVIKMYGL